MLARDLRFSWLFTAILALAPAAWVPAQSLDELGNVFGETEEAADKENEAAEAPADGEPAANTDEAGFDPFSAPDDSQAEGADTGQRTAEDVMREADELFQAGKYPEAVELYSQILAISPTYAPAALQRGRALVNMQEDELALASLSAAVDSSLAVPELNVQSLVERAKLYLRLKQYDLALADANQAVVARPADGEVRFLVGKAYNRIAQVSPPGAERLQSFNQAHAALDKAISLNPELADAYSERALTRGALQEFAEALQDIDKAIELDGKNADFAARRAYVYSSRAAFEKNQFEPRMDQVVDDYRNALTDFQRFLELSEGKTRADFRNTSPDVVTPDQAYQELASVEIGLGSELSGAERRKLYQSAMKTCDNALKYDDKSATAHFQKGIAQRLLGQYRDAIDSFSHSFQLTPSQESLLRRGIVWYHLGELERAREDFEQAIEYQTSVDGRSRFWLGATLAKQGYFGDAIMAYTQALRENPEYKPAYNNRALALMQIGEFRRAAQDFEELIRRDQYDRVAIERRDQALQMAKSYGR